MKALWFLHSAVASLAAVIWFGVVGLFMLLMAPFFLRSPRLNYAFGYTFAWPIQKLFGYKISLDNPHHLYDAPGPVVLVTNHQSALDFITLGTVIRKDTVYIGKKELWYIPIFNFFFWAGGNIFINRTNNKKAVASLGLVKNEMLKRRVSAWVFPEGTRNRGKVPLLPFKRGAFHLAIATQCPVIAFVSPPLRTYYRHEDRRIIPGVLRIRALPPYPTVGLTEKDVTALTERVRADMLASIKELEHGNDLYRG